MAKKKLKADEGNGSPELKKKNTAKARPAKVIKPFETTRPGKKGISHKPSDVLPISLSDVKPVYESGAAEKNGQETFHRSEFIQMEELPAKRISTDHSPEQKPAAKKSPVKTTKVKRDSKKKKIFVLDTSVILYNHDSINNFEDNDVAIPITVLEELDNFKKGNDTKNFEAREFIRIIDSLSDNATLTD